MTKIYTLRVQKGLLKKNEVVEHLFSDEHFDYFRVEDKDKDMIIKIIENMNISATLELGECASKWVEVKLD